MGYRTSNIDRVPNEGAAFTDYYSQQRCTAGRVRRTLLEDGLLAGIRRELLAPEVLAEFKKRVIKLLANAGY